MERIKTGELRAHLPKKAIVVDTPKALGSSLINCKACGDTGFVMLKDRAQRCRCVIEKAIAKQLPERYRRARLSDFRRDMCDLVLEWAARPTDGLFAHGPAGTGKTHLCAAIVRAFYETERSAKFKRSADLYLEVRACYGREDISEQFLIESYCHSQLLVLDDLGAGSLSDYERRIALEIVDRRLNDLLPTVITSNWTIDEIGEKIDERLASRLETFKGIGFTGKDRRKAA